MAGFYASEQVDCGGDKFTLVIDISAIDVFERKADIGFLSAFQKLEKGDIRIGTMSWLLWALLRAKHSDVSLNDAGAMLFEHGEAISAAITSVVEAAFPKAEEAKDENPPKRQRGTGKN